MVSSDGIESSGVSRGWGQVCHEGLQNCVCLECMDMVGQDSVGQGGGGWDGKGLDGVQSVLLDRVKNSHKGFLLR